MMSSKCLPNTSIQRPAADQDLGGRAAYRGDSDGLVPDPPKKDDAPSHGSVVTMAAEIADAYEQLARAVELRPDDAPAALAHLRRLAFHRDGG